MPVFPQGEIIVRNDLKYPDGAVVVDGMDERGLLLVHPLGGGLQFSVPPREVGRFESVDPAPSRSQYTAVAPSPWIALTRSSAGCRTAHCGMVGTSPNPISPPSCCAYQPEFAFRMIPIRCI
jgi:hypothetical protein